MFGYQRILFNQYHVLYERWKVEFIPFQREFLSFSWMACSSIEVLSFQLSCLLYNLFDFGVRTSTPHDFLFYTKVIKA